MSDSDSDTNNIPMYRTASNDSLDSHGSNGHRIIESKKEIPRTASKDSIASMNTEELKERFPVRSERSTTDEGGHKEGHVTGTKCMGAVGRSRSGDDGKKIEESVKVKSSGSSGESKMEGGKKEVAGSDQEKESTRG